MPEECWEKVETLKVLRRVEQREKVSDRNRQLTILKQRHENLTSGHFGVMRTMEAITRDFYWPTLAKDVKEYVESCITCQKSKPLRRKPFGKIMPLPVSIGPWRSISMDFIVKLPVSNGFDSILVVVDRFSKMSHLIPCKETIDAPGTAKLILNHVVKLHGLPDEVISDRGPQFTSKFWREVCSRLGIERKLSTPAHPQTDGQTERMNQTLEQYLRSYINYEQDNWEELLPFAEMAMNNAVSASTRRSPYEANYGFKPRFDFLSETKNDSNVPAADEFLENLKKIWNEVSKNLSLTRERMKTQQGKRREAREFEVGDMVWLETKHLSRTRPSEKLDYKRVGPYKILEKINANAYRLELPIGSRQHDVINVEKLTPFIKASDERRSVYPAPEIVNGYEEFEVERILAERRIKRKKFYLIKWKGYSDAENSWEPEENLEFAQDLLNEFRQARLKGNLIENLNQLGGGEECYEIAT